MASRVIAIACSLLRRYSASTSAFNFSAASAPLSRKTLAYTSCRLAFGIAAKARSSQQALPFFVIPENGTHHSHGGAVLAEATPMLPNHAFA